MLHSLFSVLVPVTTLFLEPPQLPAASGAVAVGLRVEREFVAARNYTDAPRWIVLRSGNFLAVRALGAQSAVEWPCTEECLWNVDLQVADVDARGVHLSASVSLSAALERGGHAVWFGEGPTGWLESEGGLDALFEEGAGGDAELCPFHVPVIRPSGRPEGDRPPPIDKKPLPPI
jgi:hypothetical protein